MPFPNFVSMLRIFCFFLLLYSLCAPLAAQETHTYLRDGDAAYEREEFGEAEIAYRRAINEETTVKGSYNLGNTLYRQNRYEEAMESYGRAAELADTPELQAAAYYNLGNAAAEMENWGEAVAAYRNALRREPNDTATKYNYAQALERYRQQQQQEQEQQEQQENEEQENEESEENEEQQEQEQEQEQNGEENQEQDPQEGEGEQEQENESSEGEEGEPEEGEQSRDIDNENADQQPAQAVSVSRQQAEELLKIIEREEQKVQEKIRKGSANTQRSDKDW